MNNDYDIDAILADFYRDTAGEDESAAPAEEDTAPTAAPAPAEPVQQEHYREEQYEEEEPDEDDAEEDESAAPLKPKQTRPAPQKRKKRSVFMPILGALLTVLCLYWSLLNIHPAAATALSTKQPAAAAPAKTPAPQPEETAAPQQTENTETAADTPAEQESPAEPEPTPEPEPEKVHYYIPEDALVAPAPNKDNYTTLSLDEAGKMLEVIDTAREYGLLGADEKVIFSPDAAFYHGSTIQYYLDESILAICWKEVIDGNTCTFSEVKIADGSQLRRKLADDQFGSSGQYYATELSASVNAVVAMNADYYAFRDFGVSVYARELFRFNTGAYAGYQKYNSVDNCFITSGGDFIFMRRGETSTFEDTVSFMTDNDVVFSLAFGPVLVDNYELQYCASYPIGEIDKGYSRAGIGQVDKLHYLYMSLNHSNEKQARWTLNEFAAHYAEKGVKNAYALDGGQTSEVVFNGKPFNYIDYDKERLVSDIIYFASAVNGGEG